MAPAHLSVDAIVKYRCAQRAFFGDYYDLTFQKSEAYIYMNLKQ